jgi:hypothetical protein
MLQERRPMKKLLTLLCIIVLTSALGACGNDSPAAPARTVRTPTPVNILAATPTVVSSPLLGTYTTTIVMHDVASVPYFTTGNNGNVGGMDLLGEWTLNFKSDGYFLAFNGLYYSGEQYIGTGTYAVTGNRLTFTKDAKCWEFYGLDANQATYTWALRGNTTLTFHTASDLCAARLVVLTSHPWQRQS